MATQYKASIKQRDECIAACGVSLFGSTSSVVGAPMKECDGVCVPSSWPSASHKVSSGPSLIYDVPASQRLQEQGWYIFSGLLNMSEGGCQEIIAGPKTAGNEHRAARRL